MINVPTATPTYSELEGRAATRGEARLGARELLLYLGAGVLLGIVFVKSELTSWYRIQEMFRFQSFHLYGIIGSALAVAGSSLALMRRRGWRTLRGEEIELPEKHRTPLLVRYWLGGTFFGLGWALLGLCPGPIFAVIGSDHGVYLVALAGALAGTWAYALLHPRLPH
jgi:uncharacterized protein